MESKQGFYFKVIEKNNLSFTYTLALGYTHVDRHTLIDLKI